MAMEYCPCCMERLPAGAGICPACGAPTDQKNAVHQLPVGTILQSPNGNSYLIGRIKGEGGFGITYVGRDLGAGGMVAVKEYFPVRCQPQRGAGGSVSIQPEMEESYRHGLRSFLSEASMLRAAGQIPSAVHIQDLFEAGGTAYMVMEYLNGSTLQEVVEKQGPLPFKRLMKDMLPLLQDVDRLHKAGVLHRDIAPDNIMRLPDGRFKLLDFGSARSMEDGRSMTVLLKPGFAPLEQYTTQGQGSFTDLYALCATIFYCITGKVPPAAPDRLMATVDGRPDPLPAPAALGAVIGQEEQMILMWGLGLQPKSRPQSIEEFLARFPKDQEPDPPHDETVQEKVVRWLKENKLLVGIVIGAILLLLLFAFS